MHEIAPWVAWHARFMVLAWAVLLPLGMLIARFFKVTPRQHWPRVLDNKFWWHCHRTLQYGGIALMTLATILAVRHTGVRLSMPLHAYVGWGVVILGWLQVIGGIYRGTKGGPQPLAPGVVLRGDHYDMTPHRVRFEYTHKIGGYLALLLSAVAIALGLRLVDAPRWMGWLIGAAWVGGLAIFAWLQRRGRCIDTYQAIWGPSLEHPGNRREPIGWGVRRIAPGEVAHTTGNQP